MAYIAGFDLGTQSAKLLILDTVTKKTVALDSFTYPLIVKDGGVREQEASYWEESLETLFKRVDEKIRSQIISIGVSGQQHGFVPMDKDGKVLSPVKLWCDTSTATECEELTAKLGGVDKVYSLIQNRILPGYTVGKVYAYKKYQSNLFDKMEHILLPHDYINYLLTGRYVTESGDASGTAYFNIEKKEWAWEVLEAIDPDKGWKNVLPTLVPSTSAIGTVSREAAAKYGIPESVTVSAGGGDNMMCAIGLGVVKDGMMAISMGTSGTLFALSEKPVIDREGTLAAFCSSSGAYLPLLCTMNCTVASENVRALLDMDVKTLDKEAEKAGIGAGGLIMLPYLNGERSPNYPNGKGLISGFTSANMTKENIARASLESAVYSLRTGLEPFQKASFNARAIALSGGGAKSPLWRQMVSDVFSLPVKVAKIGENAALGAAVQGYSAATGVSIEKAAEELVEFDETKTCFPIKGNSLKYDKVFKLYKDYEKTLSPLFS
jgi:D-xylulose kinase